jgi:hypothetical protein
VLQEPTQTETYQGSFWWVAVGGGLDKWLVPGKKVGKGIRERRKRKTCQGTHHFELEDLVMK